MLLIISATKNNNLTLSNNLEKILKEINIESETICLEDFPLPLYTPTKQEETSCPDNLKQLQEKVTTAKGLIFCAPEYNGSIPPIVTNAIAWISVSGGKDWRAAFNGKFSLVCTHSGGGGAKLFAALKQQLEHLGSICFPRGVMVTSYQPLKEDSATRILTQFSNLVKNNL